MMHLFRLLTLIVSCLSVSPRVTLGQLCQAGSSDPQCLLTKHSSCRCSKKEPEQNETGDATYQASPRHPPTATYLNPALYRAPSRASRMTWKPTSTQATHLMAISSPRLLRTRPSRFRCRTSTPLRRLSDETRFTAREEERHKARVLFRPKTFTMRARLMIFLPAAPSRRQVM